MPRSFGFFGFALPVCLLFRLAAGDGNGNFTPVLLPSVPRNAFHRARVPPPSVPPPPGVVDRVNEEEINVYMRQGSVGLESLLNSEASRFVDPILAFFRGLLFPGSGHDAASHDDLTANDTAGWASRRKLYLL